MNVSQSAAPSFALPLSHPESVSGGAVAETDMSRHVGDMDSQSRLSPRITHVGSSAQNLQDPQDNIHMAGNCFPLGYSLDPCAGTFNPGHIFGVVNSPPMAMISAPHDLLANQSAADPFRIDADAMLRAARTDDIPLMEHLLALGISAEVKDAYGCTPLILAIVARSCNAIKSLLSAGVDVGARDRFGNTPLMYAARMDDVTHIYALRDAGADVDAANQSGNTALIFAVELNHLYAVQALLESREGNRRADPNACNVHGVVPLFSALSVRMHTNISKNEDFEHACDSGKKEMVFSEWMHEMGKNSTIFSSLFDAGANIYRSDDMGKTLEDYANIVGDRELFSMLRETRFRQTKRDQR